MTTLPIGIFLGQPQIIPVGDAGGSTVWIVVNFNLSIARAEAYLMNGAGVISPTPFAVSEPLGKDSGAGGFCPGNGDFWFGVTEADPGGGGATAKMHRYVFTNVVPRKAAPQTVYDQYARDMAQVAISTAAAVQGALDLVRSRLHVV